MNFNNIRVYNFQNALYGMRNPKNSWALSDSSYGISDFEFISEIIEETAEKYDWFGVNKEDISQTEAVFDKMAKDIVLYVDENSDSLEYAAIGPNDMRLATNLIKAGPEHRKFLRQIFLTVDITAPLYFWKEFDTYKVGTVANSTSTMHKLTSKPITIDGFEIDDYQPDFSLDDDGVHKLIDWLESLRVKYLETKDKRYWKELIRWLPESWLQTRTVTMNYENLLAICSKSQRRFHKLGEWSNIDPEGGDSFIKMARDLPYAQQFIFIDENESD